MLYKTEPYILLSFSLSLTIANGVSQAVVESHKHILDSLIIDPNILATETLVVKFL